MALIQKDTIYSIDADYKKIEEELSRESIGQSIIVKILSLLGGMLGAIFITAFLFATALSEFAVGQVILGLLMVSTILINKNKLSSIFLQTFKISSFAIGLFLIFLGTQEIIQDPIWSAFIVLLVSYVSLLLDDTYFIVLISVGAIVISVVYILFEIGAPLRYATFSSLLFLTTIYCYGAESSILKLKSRWNHNYFPFRTGLLLSTLSVLAFTFFEENITIQTLHLDRFILTSIISLGLLFISAKTSMYQKLQLGLSPLTFYSILLCNGILSYFMPGISCSIILILVAFYTHHRLGVIVSILALIYFISSFYYMLDISLLYKSMILMTSGLLCLLAYFFNRTDA